MKVIDHEYAEERRNGITMNEGVAEH